MDREWTWSSARSRSSDALRNADEIVAVWPPLLGTGVPTSDPLRNADELVELHRQSPARVARRELDRSREVLLVARVLTFAERCNPRYPSKELDN